MNAETTSSSPFGLRADSRFSRFFSPEFRVRCRGEGSNASPFDPPSLFLEDRAKAAFALSYEERRPVTFAHDGVMLEVDAQAGTVRWVGGSRVRRFASVAITVVEGTLGVAEARG